MAIIIVRAASVLLSLYALAIVMRIVLSLFAQSDYRFKAVSSFLIALTGPYVNIFRRLRFLRIGVVDLAPLAAIVFISAMQLTLFESLQRGARSLLLLPLFFAGSAISIVSLVCLLLGVVTLVRVVLLKSGVVGSFADLLDRLLAPLLLRSFRALGIKRTVSFTVQLLLFAAVLLALFVVLRLLSTWLFRI